MYLNAILTVLIFQVISLKYNFKSYSICYKLPYANVCTTYKSVAELHQVYM